MRWTWIGTVAVVLLLSPAVARAETFSDAELGYSLVVPQGWRPIPISGEERYIVAKWQSDKEYLDKIEGFTMRPDLKVILFDPKGKKTAEVSKKADGSSDITISNPYRTFKDWLKSDSSGGRYISKEEKTTVNGIDTTWYEVAYEKLTTPRHGLAFVYHAEDIDYCVTTEILEQHWDKVSPKLLQCLKSFKIFPRKGSVKRETTGEGSGVRIVTDLSNLTPAERLKERQEAFERNLRISTERLTDGWTVKRSKNYVALTHTDDKYTSMMLDQAEGIREWAEATLGFVGTGLPGPEMIRICKDSAEERSFQDLSGRSGGFVQEIVCARDDGFWSLGNVAGRIFDTWLADKNPRLAYAMPPWLSRGIDAWVSTAYMKGGKLEFRPDGQLIVAMKLAAKLKKLVPIREMVQSSWEDLMNRDKQDAGADGGGLPGGMPMPGFGQRASPIQQAGGIVRFLLAGPGKSNPRTKDFLRRYFESLDAIVKANDEKPPSAAEGYQAPKTEEEEDAQFKNRQSYWKDHEKDLLKAVFDQVFKDWTDADWAAVEKSYKAYAAN